MPNLSSDDLQKIIEQRRQEFEKLLAEENLRLNILQWANHPVTLQIRELFKKLEKPFINILKKNKWKTEAEARGLCYLWNYLGFLEEIIESSQQKVRRIQKVKQQKEG